MKNNVGRRNQIPAKDIASVGRFPVVDQGQQFVSGYCDDMDRVIDFDLPLIIFGDHTRGLKYVDFPFILGADGTKVLLPDKKIYDPKFYYYALVSLDLPSRGYNRHFKSLVERCIPLPPLPEQKKIAHTLSTVQQAIEAQERIIQTTTELKKALMHKLFTEGLRNEPQKQTEIGLVPKSWEVVEIGDLGECVTGSTPKTEVSAFYEPPSEDFVAPADLGARRYVYDSQKKISPDGMATIRSIPKNSVMCVCIGSSIGKVGMTYHEESATNQQINSIICKEGRDPEFVFFLLSYHWGYWKSFATFGPVPILSKGRFTSIAISLPGTMEEQKEIAKPLVALAAKVEAAEKKVAVLKDLFSTLLHELMTAKTRVQGIVLHA
ncbi:MAG: restriction endonuclease subunit S [Verrucomicrobia bacterium]|nr:restriction endonuclease subunit S [Verrucomicrobiota bacterium]